VVSAERVAVGRLDDALPGVIGTAAVHRLATDIDDDELRAQLLPLTRRLFALPE
jgi:hypothetical protein